jgi:APA family basic amino acid/polyamine antiporter
VQFMTGPRLTWALAKDGLFFSIFAQVNSETRTPVWAVGLLGLMAGLVLLFGAETVGALTAWVVAVDALFFALTGLALVRFCWQEQKVWSWLVPGAFAALELAAVGGAVLDPSVQGSAIAGLCWMGVGAVLYGLKRVL